MIKILQLLIFFKDKILQFVDIFIYKKRQKKTQFKKISKLAIDERLVNQKDTQDTWHSRRVCVKNRNELNYSALKGSNQYCPRNIY